MFRSSFYFFHGLDFNSESKLWESGIHRWNDFLASENISTILKDDTLDIERVKSQIVELDSDISKHGIRSILSDDVLLRCTEDEMWRFYADFSSSVAYVDIETTGLSPIDSYITVIAMYAEGKSQYYVKGKGIEKFLDDIKKYPIIVTYNGTQFDIPFIEKEFNVQISAIQIDLRYVLSKLGYKGGLKKCEKKLNCMNRTDLQDVDGRVAIYLWDYYKKKHHLSALETLVFYNLVDTISLECLMVKAYNLNLKKQKYISLPPLEVPIAPQLHYTVDQRIIKEILLEMNHIKGE